MNEKKGMWAKLLDSGADALNPVNILVKIVFFFTFAVLTSFAYIVKNLDTVFEAGGSWLTYFFAFSKATWQGVAIGSSTLWHLLLNWEEKITIGHHYGTLAYAILVLILTTVIVYQVVAILFDIFDAQSGKHYPKIVAVLLSALIACFVLAPISYNIVDGDTLTSNIKEADDFGVLNETQIEEKNELADTIGNVLDLTGGNNETG
jgi:hypothetical protein